MMDDGKVTITIEIDAELLTQVTEVLKHYGLTPEEAAVQFFEYCADPKTQDHAITLLKRWKEEQEAQEKTDLYSGAFAKNGDNGDGKADFKDKDDQRGQ